MMRWQKGLGALSLLAVIAMSPSSRAQGAGTAAPATKVEGEGVVPRTEPPSAEPKSAPVAPKSAPADQKPAIAEVEPVAQKPEGATVVPAPANGAGVWTLRQVEDLWIPEKNREHAPERAPLVFSCLDFISFGVDVSVIRTDRTGNGHLGGEISFIPWISESVWWFGFSTWYSHGFIPKVNRIASGVEFGRGPFGLELAPVLFTWLPGDVHLGVAGTLFLVIPPWYSRPDYSAACCKQLSGPQSKMRSCACDRNLHAGYLVPYFRLEVGQEIQGRRQDAVASFFGVRVKYGYGY